MLLCFYWNVFHFHIQMLSDYTLIFFIDIKWHEYSITCIVKHKPLMYKNVKKLLKYCVVKYLFYGPVETNCELICEDGSI